MSELAKLFCTAIADGLKSQTMTSCSRWAMNRRVMSGDFAGNYGFKYHPWCKEIHDSTAPFTSCMKAAQIGLSEAAINRAFYTIDVLGKDVLYVLPTQKSASDFAKTRFNTALLLSPYLKQLFTDTNTVGLKQAKGVNLYIRGSRGSDDLVSIPVSVVILDEVNRMDEKKIWLALERLSGHLDKSVWAVSTPTVPKTGIHKLYEQGTKEHYFFKCPHCGKLTELIWPECVEICGDSVSDPRCSESFLKCKECGHKLEQTQKPEWLACENSQWVAGTQNENHRSFGGLSQLYSYTVTPEELVISHFRGVGDESAMVEFHNSKLGMPYIPEGGLISDAEIDTTIKAYSKNDVRPQIGEPRMICMGVDQGGIFHNVVVIEYFFDTYSNDLNVSAFAKLLWEGKVPSERFEELNRLMREWQIRGCVIDADPQINDARRFARRFPDFVTLCRYRSGQVGKEIQLSEEEGGAPVATVDRTNWMDAALGRFHSQRIELPSDTSNEFKEQIKNTVRTYEKDSQGNPQAVYLNTGADHFAHAFTYAEIALPLSAAIVTGANIKSFL